MLKTITITILLAMTPVMGADWPHWGGGLGRNMVNTTETNLPTAWDVKSGSNIVWVKPLGSLAYGNPVVAEGKVFVGTNNDGLYDKALTGDKGNILCFNFRRIFHHRCCRLFNRCWCRCFFFWSRFFGYSRRFLAAGIFHLCMQNIQSVLIQFARGCCRFLFNLKIIPRIFGFHIIRIRGCCFAFADKCGFQLTFKIIE